MSAGSFCRSASMVTTIRPRTALKPASVAAVSPAFALNRTSRTRASRSRRRRMISALLSWLPSSTKTISNSMPNPSSTGQSSVHSGGRFCSSLYTGMTTVRLTTRLPTIRRHPRGTAGRDLALQTLGVVLAAVPTRENRRCLWYSYDEHVPAAYPYPVEHTDRTRRGFLDKYPAAGRVDEDHGMSGFEDEIVEFFRRTQLQDRARHIEVERVEPPSEHTQLGT